MSKNNAGRLVAWGLLGRLEVMIDEVYQVHANEGRIDWIFDLC